MKQKTLFLVLALSLFGVGCAKEKKAASTTTNVPYVQVPSGPYIPPSNGPGYGPGQNYQYGGTATLVIDGATLPERNQRLGEYTGRSMNNPQNIVVNVNMLQYGNVYGGNITIAYTDNGQTIQGYFTSGNSAQEAAYNVWFTSGGKKVFHGFFEDFLGGLILVIDNNNSLGDGDGGGSNTQVSGSVYFKNFGLTYAPHPPTRCWFVSLGPYDCRSWHAGNGVNTYQAVHPNDGAYKRLGTFSGLNLQKAFNGTVSL